MTDDQLRAEIKRQQAIADEAYQQFTRCAASKGAAHVKTFSAAGAEARRLKEELRRRHKL